MSDAQRRAAVAEQAARAGGDFAREQFRSALDVETKANENDLVTATDREAQERVLARICEAYPSDTLVGEEDALPPGTDTDAEIRKSVPDSGATWIVDPIDGTANFVRGTRFWTTSVAAVVDTRTVGSATYLPAQGDIYTAGPAGVRRSGATISVSDRTDPGTFAVGLIGWWPSGRGDRDALFRASAERFGDLRRLGSMQGTLALVADGGLEGAFMPAEPHPWDAIAGVHLIRQAGGTATDVHGDRWTPASEGLVVSNGAAHESLLGVLQGGTDPETTE